MEFGDFSPITVFCLPFLLPTLPGRSQDHLPFYLSTHSQPGRNKSPGETTHASSKGVIGVTAQENHTQRPHNPAVLFFHNFHNSHGSSPYSSAFLKSSEVLGAIPWLKREKAPNHIHSNCDFQYTVEYNLYLFKNTNISLFPKQTLLAFCSHLCQKQIDKASFQTPEM